MSHKPSRRRPAASRPKSAPDDNLPIVPHPSRDAQPPFPNPSNRGILWHNSTKPIYTAAQRELVTKRRGELAELAFSLRALTLGFGVSRPFGDSERYDVIIDSRSLIPSRRRLPENADPNPPLWRVQVKCTTQQVEGMYRLNAHRRIGGRAVAYKLGEIHFLAAYVIPEDTWYIVPLQAFLGNTSLLFRSRDDPKPGMYDDYYEAWHLLRPD